jgi:hypothetical protein
MRQLTLDERELPRVRPSGDNAATTSNRLPSRGLVHSPGNASRTARPGGAAISPRGRR